MNAGSQLMLYRCMWLAEKMMRPTIRVALTSFDDWAAREGIWRDIRRLEAQDYLEMPEGDGHRLDRVIRLTELGRKWALGGILPPEMWGRGWDGHWRLVIFDVPESARGKRLKLREVLKKARFGSLQKSVWISPDPLDSLAAQIRKEVADCGVLTAFEGQTCFGESPDVVVKGSWDFAKVETAYGKWRRHAEGLKKPGKSVRKNDLIRWGNTERALWADCMAADPLLPRELWPEGYEGENCWTRRLEILAQAGRTLDQAVG